MTSTSELSERDAQTITAWLDGGCNSWTTPVEQIRRLLNARASERAAGREEAAKFVHTGIYASKHDAALASELAAAIRAIGENPHD